MFRFLFYDQNGSWRIQTEGDKHPLGRWETFLVSTVHTKIALVTWNSNTGQVARLQTATVICHFLYPKIRCTTKLAWPHALSYDRKRTIHACMQLTKQTPFQDGTIAAMMNDGLLFRTGTAMWQVQITLPYRLCTIPHGHIVINITIWSGLTLIYGTGNCKMADFAMIQQRISYNS